MPLQLAPRFSILSLATTVTSLAACDPAITPDYQGEPIVSFRGQALGAESTPAPPDLEAAVIWMTCQDDAELCAFTGGVGGGVSSPPELGPEGDACLEDCVELPECSEVAALGGSLSLIRCDAYRECIDACGGSSQLMTDYEIALHDGAIGQPVAIEGTFPAEFQIDIFEAPDPAARTWLGFPWSLIGPDSGVPAPKIALGLVIAKGPGSIEITPDSGVTGQVRGLAESHLIIYSDGEISPTSDIGLVLELDQPLAAGYHVFLYEYVACPPVIGPTAPSMHCGDRFTLAPTGLQTQLSVRLAPASELRWPLRVW